ncbi:MAG: DNA methyltransferase [Candidatus Aenigmatarchaeota archaeon]
MKNMIDKIEYKPEWQQLATFVLNKTTPVHNWFYYKEGFSKELVDILIKDFGIKQGHTVLDPFCGSGTTLLACKQNNINAIGLDVLPISVFASKVKTCDYDIEKLSQVKQDFMKIRFEKPIPIQMESVKFMKLYFSRYALEDIVFLRRAIAGIEDEDIRNLFTLALINTALKISYIWKDGAVLKVRKHPTPPMRKLFKRILEIMIKSLKKTNSTQTTVMVKQHDARYIPLEDESVDCVITSPPYYNNIDYTKIYKIENWFVNDIMENEPSVRSFVSGVDYYFEDMKKVLCELFRVCKKGAKLALVVGNGFLKNHLIFQRSPFEEHSGLHDGKVVESDILLSEIAEKIGFVVEKIITVNERFALKDRTTKVGKLRESIIILSKPL